MKTNRRGGIVLSGEKARGHRRQHRGGSALGPGREDPEGAADQNRDGVDAGGEEREPMVIVSDPGDALLDRKTERRGKARRAASNRLGKVRAISALRSTKFRKR